MGFNIVGDSCVDLTEEMTKDDRFISVPLTLVVDGEEMVDDESFDQKACLKKMDASPECPKSSCPSPQRYMETFLSGEDRYYVVTLSEQLSGSYNSARLGMEMAKEENPDLKIHIFNSRSASIGETLIATHIRECEEKGFDFEKTVKDTERYIKGQNTFFVLENLDVLRKNGRLSNLKSFVASALKIRPIMGATKDGSICQLSQARGINKALMKMIDFIVDQVKDSEHRTLAIAYCNCKERAQQVKEAILKRIKVKDVVLVNTGGVSTMYANDGGIIVAI